MRKLFLIILISLFSFCFFTVKASAHCEIPCGIYDDEMRINMINEHIGTIEKSMNQITKIEKEKQHHSNQLVRWIMNKERHANEIQEIVTQYFMTQRITFDTKNYETKLGLLHQMLVYSMKCKQTTNLDYLNKLRLLVQEFHVLYLK
jgi:nickel superoxide dismutase